MGGVNRHEKPVHRVTLTKGFFMGVHTVTQAQWKAVMASDPSQFKGPNRPVEHVTWTECQEFCTKLTTDLKGRVPVRLPTEAEWEYACRAGTRSDFHFGSVIHPELVNYSGKSFEVVLPKGKSRSRKPQVRLVFKGKPRNSRVDGTMEVGSFASNPWGLFDMHGNVWEWCQDRYGRYAAMEETDPQGGPNEGSRVLRGGTWDGIGDLCRAGFRLGIVPVSRNDRIGLRVVLPLDL